MPDIQGFSEDYMAKFNAFYELKNQTDNKFPQISLSGGQLTVLYPGNHNWHYDPLLAELNPGNSNTMSWTLIYPGHTDQSGSWWHKGTSSGKTQKIAALPPTQCFSQSLLHNLRNEPPTKE